MALINRYMISGLMLKNLEEGNRQWGVGIGKLEPLNLKLEPLNLKLEPLSLKLEPLNLKVASLNLKPESCTFEPEALSSKPLSAQSLLSTPHSLLEQVEFLPVAREFLTHSNCNQKGDGQQPPPFFLIAGQSADLCLAKRCWGQDYANALVE